MDFLNEKMLNAFAYYSDNDEIYDQEYLKGFSNTKFEIGRGLHIRWMVSRYIGFPEHGFLLTKASDGTPMTNSPISLPKTSNEFIQRALEGLTDNRLRDRVQERLLSHDPATRVRNVDQLMKSIQLLKSRQEIPQYLIRYPGEEHHGIGVLDSLLLASLDPFIAKGLGLYKIFDLNASGSGDQFREIDSPINVTGYWGSENYPYLEESFENVPIQNNIGEKLKLNYMSFIPMSANVINVEAKKNDSENNRSVCFVGGLDINICLFEFDFAVDCVEFTLVVDKNESHKFDNIDWSKCFDSRVGLITNKNVIVIKKNSGSDFDIYLIRVELNTSSDSLRIDFPLKEIKLIQGLRLYPKFEIPIGQMVAQTHTKDYPSELSKHSVKFGKKSPIVLDIKPSHPFFNREGKIVKDANDIYIGLDYSYHPDYDLQPIRFILAKNSLINNKSELITKDNYEYPQPVLLNRIAPRVVDPDLILYTEFNGSFLDEKYQSLVQGLNTDFVRFAEDLGVSLGKESYVKLKYPKKIIKDFTVSFFVRLFGDIKNTVLFHSENENELKLEFDGDENIVVYLNGSAFVFPFLLESSSYVMSNRREYWFILRYNGKVLNLSVKNWENRNINTFIFHNVDSKEQSLNKDIGNVDTPLNDLGGDFYFGSSQTGRRSPACVIKKFTLWSSPENFYSLSKKFHEFSRLPQISPHKNQLYKFISEKQFIKSLGLKIKVFEKDLRDQELIQFIESDFYTINFWFKIGLDLDEIRRSGRQGLIKKLISFEYFTKSTPSVKNIPIFYKLTGKVDRFSINSENIEGLHAHIQCLDKDESPKRLRFNPRQWNQASFVVSENNIKIRINGEEGYIHSETGLFNLKNIFLGEKKGDGFDHIAVWNGDIKISTENYLLSSVQYIDRQVKEGDTFEYISEGIDILGRKFNKLASSDVSPYSQPAEIDVPTSPLARLDSIQGVVESCDSEMVEVLHQERTQFTAEVAFTNFNFQAISDLSEFSDHYLVVYRKLDKRVIQQRFHINKFVSISDNKLRLTFYEPPFSQIEPRADDTCVVDIDIRSTLEWKWTGLQQVYNPEVKGFKIYKTEGHENSISRQVHKVLSVHNSSLPKKYTFSIEPHPSLISLESDLYKGQVCSIEMRQYLIDSITIDASNPNARQVITVTAPGYDLPEVRKGQRISFSVHDISSKYIDQFDRSNWGSELEALQRHVNSASFPLNSPSTRIEFDDIALWQENLAKRGIDWLPSKNLCKVYLSGISATERFVSTVKVDGYVPSAIVAQVVSKSTQPWEAFTVLWHEWENNSLVCYMLLKNEPNKNSNFSDLHKRLRLANAKFYQGEKYTFDHELKALPTYDVFNKENHRFAVTAASTTKESDVAISNDVVLVDKSIPALPDAPVAKTDGIADYYKKIKVELNWNAVNSIGNNSILYNVFSSSYANIAATDLESRRLGRGYYKGSLQDKKLAFVDDHYVDHWLEVCFAREWQDPLDSETTFRVANIEALFPDKYRQEEPHKVSVEWRKMSVVWNHWADRFYHALSNESRQVIAQRPGNEEAFSLLNSKPINENIFVDYVQGFYPDQFYYRIKVVAKSLVGNLEWTNVSNPVEPSLSRKPRKPEISKVVPGDRSVTLYWNLNREPDLSHYLIYRAQNREDLEDLRWYKQGRDPRIVGEVKTTLLKTKSKVITVYTNIDYKEIKGIYIAQNGLSESNLEMYFNYWDGSLSVLENVFHEGIGFKYKLTLNIKCLVCVAMCVVIKTPNNNLKIIENKISQPFVYDGDGNIKIILPNDVKLVNEVFVLRGSVREIVNYSFGSNERELLANKDNLPDDIFIEYWDSQKKLKVMSNGTECKFNDISVSTEHFYCLVAVLKNNIHSDKSKVVFVKPNLGAQLAPEITIKSISEDKFEFSFNENFGSDFYFRWVYSTKGMTIPLTDWSNDIKKRSFVYDKNKKDSVDISIQIKYGIYGKHHFSNSFFV